MVELLYAKDWRRRCGISTYQLHYRPHHGGASNNHPRLQVVGRAGAEITAHWWNATREQVSTWYFEVWNEPDIDYWHGTPAEYFKLYDYAVAA